MTSKAAFIAKLKEKPGKGRPRRSRGRIPSVRGRILHKFQGWQILISEVAKIGFQLGQAILLLS